MTNQRDLTPSGRGPVGGGALPGPTAGPRISLKNIKNNLKNRKNIIFLDLDIQES